MAKKWNELTAAEKAVTLNRLTAEVVAKTEPARLDANRKARPKTRLVGHVPDDMKCRGPQSTTDDLYIENQETGDRFRVR